MEHVSRALGHQRWSVEEIPFPSIDRDQVDTTPELFYLVTASSFVEITSDIYTGNLVEYFRGDAEVRSWLEEQWQREELQHGVALKRYISAAWPDFDWERAYRRFLGEYSRCCAAKQLGPTPALEMVSRCVVETGTATMYMMIQRMSPEPVLRSLAARISADEVRHYKYFYHYFLRYQEQECLKRSTILRTLWHRVSEIDGEDGYYSFKHAFVERHPSRSFNDADYKKFRGRTLFLARNYYPYEMAAKMLLKPLGLSGRPRQAATWLLSTGAAFLS